jgi:hypothetical protein
VIAALMSRDPAQRPDEAQAAQLLADAAAGLGAAPGTAGTSPASASAEPVLATAGPVSATARPVSATAPPVTASARPVSASASSAPAGDGPAWTPAGTVPAWAPAGADPGGASARTDRTGFPASDGATVAAGPGLAAFAPGAGGLLADPPAAPFARAIGASRLPAAPGPFPTGPGPGLFPAAAGPAVIPATGPPPLPVSMGAAPVPAGVGAASHPGARPPAGRRLLVLGIAAAVVVAGLVWWLVAGPSAHGRASGANGAAAPAARPLPAGYRWYTRPAGGAGAPGFTMAAPAGWPAHRRGAAAYLRNPVSGGIIGVTLAPATAGGPVREARILERAAVARGTFTGYHRIAITPFLVRGKLAGAWRFSYRQPGAGLMEGLVVVSRVTAPGSGRPYELMAAAPSASWPQTMAAFAEAARTFSPGR